MYLPVSDLKNDAQLFWILDFHIKIMVTLENSSKFFV